MILCSYILGECLESNNNLESRMMRQSNFCHGCTQHQLRIFILFSSYNGYEIEPTHTKMQSNSAQTHLEIISLQRGSLVSALLQLPLGSTTSKLAVTSCYTWPYPTQCTELHTAEAKTGSGNSRLISTPHSESAHEVFSPSSAGIETTQIRISNLTKSMVDATVHNWDPSTAPGVSLEASYRQSTTAYIASHSWLLNLTFKRVCSSCNIKHRNGQKQLWVFELHTLIRSCTAAYLWPSTKTINETPATHFLLVTDLDQVQYDQRSPKACQELVEMLRRSSAVWISTVH